jgi:hypothetical protein
MSSNQNPVFTDNETVFGDGTEEHPLTTSGGAPVANAPLQIISEFQAGPDGTTDGTNTDIMTASISVPAAPAGVSWKFVLWGMATAQLGAAQTKSQLQIYDGDSSAGTLLNEGVSEAVAADLLQANQSVLAEITKDNSANTYDFTLSILPTGGDGTVSGAQLIIVATQVIAF